MSEPTYMLACTLARLRNEFEAKKRKLKGEVADSIGQGYETGGGWHDNALFEGTLMDQSILASQLTQISRWLDRPVLINQLPIPGDQITLGTRVVLERKETGQEPEILDLKILGPADLWFIREGAISYLSPLFEQIKLHRQGDLIRIEEEGGVIEILVLRVESLFASKE
jgi:transcription elongation GreA/GreB family factor